MKKTILTLLTVALLSSTISSVGAINKEDAINSFSNQTSTKINGVVTIRNTPAATYTSHTGGRYVKTLRPGSKWEAQEIVYASGAKWYRVGVEWVNALYVTEDWISFEASGVVKVTWAGAVNTYTTFHEPRTWVKTVAAGTEWRFSKKAFYKGEVWFCIGREWINGKYIIAEIHD